jgi:hypothetical protein
VVIDERPAPPPQDLEMHQRDQTKSVKRRREEADKELSNGARKRKSNANRDHDKIAARTKQ